MLPDLSQAKSLNGGVMREMGEKPKNEDETQQLNIHLMSMA